VAAIQRIRQGEIPTFIRVAAEAESVAAEYLAASVAEGKAVVTQNSARALSRPCAIGLGLRTKVNANIGTSPDFPELEGELEKLDAAVGAGADTVMDLSTGGDVRVVRSAVLERCPVPVGTVPVYEAVVRCGGVADLTESAVMDCVRDHAAGGVDFMTLHCGVTKEVVARLEPGGRACGIVSRGGSFIARWMAMTGKENPLFSRFDEVMDIAAENEVTLSLGDGLRPGALADSMDGPQIAELEVLCDLAKRALAAGVQAMIEGPGHVPLDQIREQVRLEKELSGGVPFYVLGPLVTDVAPGYDHITAAIGGAIAAAEGADFLCYVTPSEHLGLPDVEHVREGVIAARIAAHAGDIAKGVPGAREADERFSRLRRERNWEGQLELCMDPGKASAIRRDRKASEEDVCSMCGEYCVFKGPVER
jgi:phosphomethylpyrimidine synthase